jgi:hypothetical protein
MRRVATADMLDPAAEDSARRFGVEAQLHDETAPGTSLMIEAIAGWVHTVM